MNSVNKIKLMLNLKKSLLIVGMVVVALVLALCVQKPEEPIPPPLQSKELKLSDFPEVFKDNTLIIIGDEASEIELQAAKEIADYLEKETGNKPLIKRYSEVSDKDRKNNLIIVGTPKSNPMLKEVYAMADVLEVNESFPGVDKGVLEILWNPWDKKKVILLVEGWNKDAIIYLTSKLDEWKNFLTKKSIMTFRGVKNTHLVSIEEAINIANNTIPEPKVIQYKYLIIDPLSKPYYRVYSERGVKFIGYLQDLLPIKNETYILLVKYKKGNGSISVFVSLESGEVLGVLENIDVGRPWIDLSPEVRLYE